MSGLQDVGVTVATVYRTRLRYLRQITLWTLLLFVVMVFVSVTLELTRNRAPLPAVAFLALAAAASCAMSGYFMIMSVGEGTPTTRRVWTALAVAGVGAFVAPAVSPVLYPSATEAAPQWLMLGGVLSAAVVAGSGLPRLATTAAGTALSALAGAGCAAVGGYHLWWTVVMGTFISLVCSGTVAAQVWFWDVAAQVDRARQVEGEAAVAGERLRFAAELHDIQGHSLQVIALKSELAARLVGTDPARAVAEMREVESLARQALRDTREVAHGYRTVSLTTEIANATRVLAAAGVSCTTASSDMPGLPPAAERLLGLVVREATTNVIRHSRAAHAEITLTLVGDRVRLLVRNDAPLVPPAPDPTVTDGGLSGLADRFTAAGGTLTRHHGGDTFTVTAEVAVR